MSSWPHSWSHEPARKASSLIGEGGLPQRLTKLALEGALEGEMTDHLGYQAGDPAGRNGGNCRNGHRTKTLLTEIGPVDIKVPREAPVHLRAQDRAQTPTPAGRHRGPRDLPVRQAG